MYPLLPLSQPERPKLGPSAGVEAEDRYYRDHAPSGRRRLVPLVSLSAIVGMLAIVVDHWRF